MRRDWHCRFLVGFAALVTLGCGAEQDDPSRDVVVDTIAGVAVVRNPASGRWDEDDVWTLDEEFRLGGPSAPVEEAFGSLLTAVSVGPHGNIYILDHQADEVRVFDPTGEYRFTFGGHGRGPGELNNPTSLAWDSTHRLWIPNAFDGRYTVFDSLGNLVETTTGLGRRGVNRLLYPLHFDDDGQLVDHLASSGVQLIQRDTTGIIIDSLAFLPHPPVNPGGSLFSFMTSDSTSEALRALRPRLVWTVGPDGSIWHARKDSLRLFQRSLSGDTIRVIETSHRERSFTEIEQSFVSHAERDLDRLDREIVMAPPVLQMIYVLDDGHLLVQVAEEMNEPGRTMDVFDRDGRLLGSMEWPFAPHPGALHAFAGDTVYAVTIDTLDVPYVVKAVIRR